MKKLLIISCFALAVCSCSHSDKNAKKPDESASNSSFANYKGGIYDASKSAQGKTMNGMYKGFLPSADCEGMNVTILITDSTFIRHTAYLANKDSVFTEKGTIGFNGDSTIITLKNVDEPNRYKVTDSTLTQLDMDGKVITGKLAKMYILKKK